MQLGIIELGYFFGFDSIKYCETSQHSNIPDTSKFPDIVSHIVACAMNHSYLSHSLMSIVAELKMVMMLSNLLTLQWYQTDTSYTGMFNKSVSSLKG